MKQSVEEAAKENILFNHRTVDRTLSGSNLAQFGITNFIQGAEWQANQSPWISVKDELPPLNKEVIVYNGKQIYMSHRTDNDYAKDANSFLYGLQTFDVVAWMHKPKFNV